MHYFTYSGPGGALVTKANDISNAFSDLYKNLYTSSASSTQQETVSFLDRLGFPSLDEGQREYGAGNS